MKLPGLVRHSVSARRGDMTGAVPPPKPSQMISRRCAARIRAFFQHDDGRTTIEHAMAAALVAAAVVAAAGYFSSATSKKIASAGAAIRAETEKKQKEHDR